MEELARKLQSRMATADRIGLGEKIREWLPRVQPRETQQEGVRTIPR